METRTTKIFIRQWPVWSCAPTLKEAKQEFKRQTSDKLTDKAEIICLYGEEADLDKVTIDDMGTISRPKEVISIKLQ